LASFTDFWVILGFRGFFDFISSLTFFSMPSRFFFVRYYLRRAKRAWKVPFKIFFCVLMIWLSNVMILVSNF
jgi:hypothetical protein